MAWLMVCAYDTFWSELLMFVQFILLMKGGLGGLFGFKKYDRICIV